MAHDERRHPDEFSTVELIGLGFLDLEAKLRILLHLERYELMALEALDAQVAQAEAEAATHDDVTNAASALFDRLARIITANANDPAALQALADRLSSATASDVSANQRLADAIVANTPAAPTP